MLGLFSSVVSSQKGRVLLRVRKAEPTELIGCGTEEDAGRSRYQDLSF